MENHFLDRAFIRLKYSKRKKSKKELLLEINCYLTLFYELLSEQLEKKEKQK